MNVISRKIGGHVSAAGGVDKAIERAHEIGANCVQIFSGSPRVWQRPSLESVNAEKMFAKQKELSVSLVFTHSLYLVNFASENPELVRKSTEAVSFDLRFDGKLNGAGVVVHVGSHQGRGWDAVKNQVAAGIAEVIKNTPENSRFLIENAAGQNGKIGGDLQEIRWLLDEISSPRLGWCLDTCHAFAAGYSLGKEVRTDAAKPENAERHTILQEVDRLKLWDELWCVHVNDSRDPFGSGRDRHDNLGDGNIPKEDFEYFLNHDLINDKPLIIEVPGIDDEGPDAENIRRLKFLIK